MINKKNLLGKTPDELGTKDAVHVAIVAVRAAKPISRGARCGINEYGEAIPKDDGCGIADPFSKKEVFSTGNVFWLLLDQDEVPNVRHEWEHPEIAFAAPTRGPSLNKRLVSIAKQLGLEYHALMDMCSEIVNKDVVKYTGTIPADKLDKIIDDIDGYDLFMEWAEETGHEFENYGTECCPEYNYPSLSYNGLENTIEGSYSY